MSARLQAIAESGNYDRTAGDNWITCADGLKLSVIAGRGAYCVPRPSLFDPPLPGMEQESSSYPGPYTHVEVGFPSEKPEPWDGDGGWGEYAENPDDPTGTVYGYVPVELVRSLIDSHGGEA